jgi:hypothetical protein
MVANLTSFETLDQREYVAFGVLEPGGFGAAVEMAPLGLLSPGMSSFSIATPPDFSPQSFDIIHLPERLAGFGRPGIGRRMAATDML